MLLNIPHVPVLYREVIDVFKNVDDGIIIDCTLGYGGHTSMLLEAYPNIKVIGIDQDKTAIDFSTNRLKKYGKRVSIKQGKFSEVIKEILLEVNITDIKGVLADIGVSSLQLDEKERGFSYESDNLDMRMNKEATLTAQDVVNTYEKQELEKILLDYGELRNYKKITSVILENRPFSSAKDLSEKLKPHLPHGKKIHPATLLMQAIRIEVNDELGELRSLLKTLEDTRLTHADIAIISFHSLEDRIVKQTFSTWSKSCTCPSDIMRCMCGNDNALGKLHVKKPIMAQDDELKENARSRSAKMRVFEMDIA